MPYPLTGSPLSASTLVRNSAPPATLTPIRTTPGLTGAPRVAGLAVYPSATAIAVATPPTTGQIWPRSASPGTQGPTGPIGLTGPAGPGVPTGGTVNQMLTKTSSFDYATAWTSVPKITVSATAPASPGLNDLWVDLS